MKKRTNFVAAGLFLAAISIGLGQPVITTQPQSQTNIVGTTAAFSVEVAGTLPIFYQWQKSSTDLTSQTNTTLVLTNVQTGNAGPYSVIVTNADGVITSDVATLTVLVPPNITKQPTNQTASLFADATFRVTATGDPLLSYQWRFNDGDLIGRTNTSLTVTNVQRTNAGNYSVVVTNLSGSITSQVATLTITPFNSIYCFGFSWTATHLNCQFTTDPTRYYLNHPSNGPLWPEYLSTNLGLAYNDANNRAQCGAYPLDILGQVNGFPAPPKPQLSLYCLWQEYEDAPLAITNQAAWDQIIPTLNSNMSNAVHRLYLRGARQIVIEIIFDLSKLPGKFPEVLYFGTNSAGLAKYSEFEARCNAAFVASVNTYSQTKPDLRIIFVDVFSKLNEVLANPVQYGFTKTTVDALADPLLTNKSFAGPGADYVFWDQYHGTTKLNQLITTWHLEALTNSIQEKLQLTTTGGTPNIQMNRLLIGRDYTLQTSSNLTTWSDVQSFTAAAGTNQWAAPPASSDSGYYRLKWQP